MDVQLEECEGGMRRIVMVHCRIWWEFLWGEPLNPKMLKVTDPVQTHTYPTDTLGYRGDFPHPITTPLED